MKQLGIPTVNFLQKKKTTFKKKMRMETKIYHRKTFLLFLGQIELILKKSCAQALLLEEMG